MIPNVVHDMETVGLSRYDRRGIHVHTYQTKNLYCGDYGPPKLGGGWGY